MPRNAEEMNVKTAVQHYLSGISDAGSAAESLSNAFYSSTNLHSVNDNGELQFQTRDSLVNMVLSGSVPEHQSDIMSVEIINDMAFAKVHLDMPDRHYYDYLTLLKLNVGWRIVSKTYTAILK